MWAIWTKYLLPQALKSCPKCNKFPNLVTLVGIPVTVVLLIAGQTLRSQTPSREACLSRLLQGVRQQVQIHLARQREAQGHDQGCVGAMQDLSNLLSR